MWISEEHQLPDIYGAFRGKFYLEEDCKVEVRVLGASWFVAWLDGVLLGEGPARFAEGFEEYERYYVTLKRGHHVLASEIHHNGVATRMLVDMQPYFYCELLSEGKKIKVDWKCLKLEGYASCMRKVGECVGWMEWCDTRKNPDGWTILEFDDASWCRPVGEEKIPEGKLPVNMAPVKQIIYPVASVDEGALANMFNYEFDDIPTRFFLRDLTCKSLPAQGVWRRYDLGFIRLGRPRFVLDLPQGALVEFAYSEYLVHDRVSPYITLMGSSSCNLDHYIARGGVQEFMPMTPRGGRFVEIHVIAPEDQVKFLKEEYVERSYHGKPEGSFMCSDELLNKIWSAGVETYRTCAEDAIVDCPTRERGQWTGDTVNVGLNTAAAVYSDVRVARRCLTQAAQCAGSDGMIPGLFPGQPCNLVTYALQWVGACVRYYSLTGDLKLLEELYGAAVLNMSAFERHTGDNGLSDSVGASFVDWGYVRTTGPVDMGLNYIYLDAIDNMIKWCSILNMDNDRELYIKQRSKIFNILRNWIDECLNDNGDGWEKVGYHCAVFCLNSNLAGASFLDKERTKECIAFIKKHILNCFPNNPAAPRHAEPAFQSRQLITPYFAHFAFPALIKAGETDFVLEQYRKCWGWMLEQGVTTILEVFDIRWSHCHQWSACPTWQLSRYVLGLHPCFEKGYKHYRLELYTGNLGWVEGAIPVPDCGDAVNVSWRKASNGIEYSIFTKEKIWLHMTGCEDEAVEITGQYNLIV